MTAPTNKAVRVLARSSKVKSEGWGGSSVDFSTIHKLLGLKEVITDSGLQLFQNDNFDKVNIKDYQLVVVDETSMLNDELFLELDRYAKDVMIIFLGDPAQIPPVNKYDSIPFIPQERAKYKIEMALLKEIMRQKEGNPIIEHSFAIRKDLTVNYEDDRKTNLTEHGTGIVFINANDPIERDSFMTLLNDHFTSPEFNLNPDYAKLIAWRNKTINEMNVVIRKMIYGSSPTKIMPGEKLITNKPIVSEKGYVQFTTNEEFEVVSHSIGHDTNHKVKFYNTHVKSIELSGSEKFEFIRILHEDSEIDFNLKAEHLKKAAMKAKDKFQWKMYYNFLNVFAQTNYNYAITCHKAQGSTYSNVFLLEDDINFNSNVIERNRIKYTASTRPTNKLFIVKR
jgi:hypothetical protein